jgi:hypothetical protein
MPVSETYRAGAAIVFPRRLPHACPPEAFHIGNQNEWPTASCFPAERSEHFARLRVAILLNTSEQNPGTLIQIRGPKRRKQNSRQPENVRRTGLCAFDLDRCVR